MKVIMHFDETRLIKFNALAKEIPEYNPFFLSNFSRRLREKSARKSAGKLEFRPEKPENIQYIQ